MHDRSFWLDSAPPFVNPDEPAFERHVDVVVVGAGLTGLSTAYHLALQGVAVAIVEAETVGWGASGRNGGMATTGLAISLRKAVARYGADAAVQMREFYNDAISLIESIDAREGRTSEFRRAGLLNLAARRSHVDGYREEASLISSLTPHKADFLDGQRLRDEIGSGQYFAGMIDPAGASVHPAKFVRLLAHAVLARGGAIHERARVTGVSRLGAGGYRVQSSRGWLEAQHLVVATGAYSSPPFGWLQRRVAQVGSFIVTTEPLNAEVASELLPHRRVCSDSKELLNYFRLSEDNRLVFGGRARFVSRDPAVDPKSGDILTRQMKKTFPQLSNVGIEYRWGGLVDISLDRMVHSGRGRDYHYAIGYTGHGVQMATFMGKVLADDVMGKGRNPWADLRNPPIPGHFGRPWFVPFAGLYYQARDRLSR